MGNYKLSVVIEKAKDGYYAYCPELQGCYTQADTYEDAVKNIRDAIKLHILDRIANGEEIPQAEMTSLTNIEVSV